MAGRGFQTVSKVSRGNCPSFLLLKFRTMTATLLFLGNLGGSELVLIFLVVLLLFGGQKIPELMRGLGRGIREFNSAKNSVEDEIRQGMREAEKKNIEK